MVHEPLKYRPIDADAESRPSTARRVLLTALAVAMFAAVGAGIWWAYRMGKHAGSEATAPVIVADDRPIKVRPDAPGGMEVPHQDKLVYDRIAPGTEPATEERLLPPPEAPAVAAMPEAGGEPAGTGQPSAGAQPDSAAPTPGPGNGAIATAPAPKPAPAQPVQDPPPAAEEAADSAPTAPAPGESVAMAGPFRLQLASMRSAEAATTAWTQLQGAHGDVLSRFELIVEKVDLGSERGVFYRVQAGPVASESDAKRICEVLTARQVGCLVIRR